jgi:hypothetical protein
MENKPPTPFPPKDGWIGIIDPTGLFWEDRMERSEALNEWLIRAQKSQVIDFSSEIWKNLAVEVPIEVEVATNPDDGSQDDADAATAHSNEWSDDGVAIDGDAVRQELSEREEEAATAAVSYDPANPSPTGTGESKTGESKTEESKWADAGEGGIKMYQSAEQVQADGKTFYDVAELDHERSRSWHERERTSGELDEIPIAPEPDREVVITIANPAAARMSGMSIHRRFGFNFAGPDKNCLTIHSVESKSHAETAGLRNYIGWDVIKV